MPVRWWAAIAAGLLLGGCASRGPVLTAMPPAPGQPQRVELTETPFFPQRDYQCGPAALAASLVAVDVPVTPDELTPQVYVPAHQGSLQPEMIAATRRHDRVPYVIAPELPALVAEVAAGRPVLVLQNLGVSWMPVWHYALVVGYDRAVDAVVLRSGTTKRKLMNAAEFARTWQLGGNWGLVVLPATELPASADRDRYLAAIAGLEATGRLVIAEQGYRTALDRWPDAGLAWFGLGNVTYRLGRREEAGQAFEQAMRLRPGDAAVVNNLAQVQAELGCPARGLRTLNSLPDDATPSPELLVTLDATRREISALPTRAGACGGS